MDYKLKERLEKIDKQIQVVYESEEKFLTIEAAKENIKACLVAKASGTSQAARETLAEATQEWATFSKNLAIAKAIFHREKHYLELKLKAFDAEFLSLKLETNAIRRQL